MIRYFADWEFDPEELSDLFEKKGWVHGAPVNGVPSAEGIEHLLRALVEDVNSGRGVNDIVARSRFAAVRHPDMDSVDLYLNIGNVSIEDDDQDPDAPSFDEGVISFLIGLGILRGENL